MSARVYIVSPAYDWAFFLGPPALAFGLGALVASSALFDTPLVTPAGPTTVTSVALGALIHAHLVAVLVRSHGNAEVRRRHPVRFYVAPVVLFFAIALSAWVAIAATVVATFWDVWHSGAQTFGFTRIYDRNAGVEQGPWPRRLDYWVNQLLYAGPILGGATLAAHVGVLEDFETQDGAVSDFLILVPFDVLAHQAWLLWSVLGGGAALLALYVALQVRAALAGDPPSWPKVWLLVTTGLVSLFAWGFNSFGEAFLIMNTFHAVQYLALIWASEGPRWKKRRGRLPAGVLLGAFLLTVGGYGLAVELLDPDLELLWAGTLVVSLLHFWYDGFIWSVREAHV